MLTEVNMHYGMRDVRSSGKRGIAQARTLYIILYSLLYLLDIRDIKNKREMKMMMGGAYGGNVMLTR